jgi:hypothetical protein
MPAHHAPRSTPRPARVPPLAAALAALAALAAPGAPRALGAQAAGDTVRHVVVMAGNAAGTQRSWRTSDGAWHAHFTYNDRGRGPAIDEHVTLGADGLPTRIDVSGVDYMKNAVGERFERRGGVGTWRSAMERGSSRAPGFYMSMDGAPGETALLVRAALRRPDGAVPLLPAGRATVRAAARRTLRADGRERAVTLYEIADVGFQPAPVWLDADGELFAVGGSWQMTVREGWEAAAPELIAAQDSLASIRRAALASRLARRPATPVVFTNAAVFDPRTGTSARGMSVVVRGDRIERVGRGLPIPAGAERIDLAGRTLMPGMWDMHVHAGDDGGLLFPRRGDHHRARPRRRRRGRDGAPPRALRRRHPARPADAHGGLIDGPGPFQAPAKDLVSSEDQARATVEKFARLGYQQIKLYSSLDPKLVPLLAREAHARGCA